MRVAQSVLQALFVLHALLMAAFAQAQTSAEIDDELFDLGALVGVVNIQDFGSEPILGVSLSFQASEDFFLQFNATRTEAEASAFEQSQGLLFDGRKRLFRHYDALLGYTVLRGEFFLAEREASLSSLYVVGGLGETEFGGERRFSYTLGIGYQIEWQRHWLLRADARDTLYRSSLIAEDELVNAFSLSLGLGYLF